MRDRLGRRGAAVCRNAGCRAVLFDLWLDPDRPRRDWPRSARAGAPNGVVFRCPNCGTPHWLGRLAEHADRLLAALAARERADEGD